MAKVIFIDNEGKEKLLRKDAGMTESDVLFRQDYFASKLWSRDDIEQRLKDLGYDYSKDDVDDVIDSGGKWNGLAECTDSDWCCIDDEITCVMKAKASTITGVSVTDIEWDGGDFPTSYTIPGSDLTNDDRLDLMEAEYRNDVVEAWLEAETGCAVKGFVMEILYNGEEAA